MKFDAAGRPCRLLFTPAGETRWVPARDGVRVVFNGAGCATTSSDVVISWDAVAARAAGNPDFAMPWLACLRWQAARP